MEEANQKQTNSDSSDKPIVKLKNLQLTRGWQWLLYIDFILPLLIYLSALLPIGAMRGQLARIFHSYMLYILFPWPDFKSITGIVAPLLHLYFLINGIRKKQRSDVILSFVFYLIVVLIFTVKIDGTAINYFILRFLDFGL